MQLALLYLSTAATFLVLDALMLKTVIGPTFQRHLGGILLDEFRLGPAVAFYLMYVAGLLWFVSIPALRADLPVQALIGGAILGAMAYGTYEFTNLATLRDWSWSMVALDLTWGSVLTAVSAFVGVSVARTFG